MSLKILTKPNSYGTEFENRSFANFLAFYKFQFLVTYETSRECHNFHQVENRVGREYLKFGIKYHRINIFVVEMTI